MIAIKSELRDLIPLLDPRLVLEGGYVLPDTLRVRAILRRVCRYTGRTLTSLDALYPTSKEWKDACLAHQTTRRLTKAARGVRPRGDGLTLNPFSRKEEPLWERLIQDHPGASRVAAEWIYEVIDPSVCINSVAFSKLFVQFPYFIRWCCASRAEDKSGLGAGMFLCTPKDEVVRQLADMLQLEGPFAALGLVRLLKAGGFEANFFELRGYVYEHLLSSRDVGEAFGSDLQYVINLVNACIHGDPARQLAYLKARNAGKQATAPTVSSR